MNRAIVSERDEGDGIGDDVGDGGGGDDAGRADGADRNGRADVTGALTVVPCRRGVSGRPSPPENRPPRRRRPRVER